MVLTERNKTDELGCESVRKLLFRLAAPAIAAQIINLLYSLVDRMYIGHIIEIGKLALTGVGVCLPLIMIISAFAVLVSMGGAPQASIFLGKGEKEKAEKTLGNSITLLLIISIILTVIFQFFAKDMLLAFGASTNTIGYATEYMRIYSLGTLFVQMTLGLNAFITAQGFEKTSMHTVLIGAVLNIVLDPIFIFVLNMGVKGAALATIISQCVSMIFVLRFLTGKKTTIRIKTKHLKLKRKVFLPCLALGFAPFIMQSTESIVVVCFNSSLLKYGGDLAVGAMTVLTSVMQFLMLPLIGLAQGAQPIMSYNFGAKNGERVRRTYKLLLSSCLAYSVVIWVTVELCPQMFIKIFNSDALLVNFTVPALRIFVAVSCIFGIQIACQQTLIALGDAKSAFSVAILRKIVLLIPLIYIMPALPLSTSKTTAIYMAEPIVDFVSVTFTAILFTIRFKTTMGTIEEYSDSSHRLSGLYRFLRKTIRLFTKPMETVWEVPFEGKPAVFVCNHDRAFGPIAMCAHFELAEDIRPWINAQVLSTKESPEYIRNDYWWDLSKWYSPILGHSLVYIYALIVPRILRGSDCVPVYHDTGVMSTLRHSIRMLNDGKHLLLFPEHPIGYRKYGEKIFDGFVSIGRLYYAKTKEIVYFYPINVDWEAKKISVGKPIPYDPTIKYEEQVSITTVGVEDYFNRFKQQ